MHPFTCAVSIAAASIAFTLSTAPAHAVTSCKDDTVTGSYGEFVSTNLKGSSSGAAAVGIVEFNGAGKLKGNYTFVSTNHPEYVTIKGTYKVNSKCQIDLVYDALENGVKVDTVGYTGVLINGGAKINAIATSESAIPLTPIAVVFEAIQ